MNARVYVASALDALEVARAHAEECRAIGLEVASTWHDTVTAGTVDPLDNKVRRAVLYSNIHELESSNVVLADTRIGTPAATFGEIAYAIARGLRVVWVQPKTTGGVIRRACIFDAHPAVLCVFSPFDAAKVAARWSQS